MRTRGQNVEKLILFVFDTDSMTKRRLFYLLDKHETLYFLRCNFSSEDLMKHMIDNSPGTHESTTILHRAVQGA